MDRFSTAWRHTPVVVRLALATILGMLIVQAHFRRFDDATNFGLQQRRGKSNDILLLAYYYAWYNENDWSRFGTQGVYPLQGLYGSKNVHIAEQHNEWAQRAGIDAWVVSWRMENPNSNFRKAMLQSNNFHKMKYCLLFESKEALPTRNFTDERALNTLVDSMKLMRDHHFNHSSYLHVNGRPVVVLYITRSWTKFGPSLVDIVKKKVGVDIFFIADEPWFGPQSDPSTAMHGIDQNGKQVFDAYTTYNMYTHGDTQQNQTAVDYMMSPKITNVLEQWSNKTVFFPNVLPKYHHFRPYGHQLTGDAAGLRAQLDTFACLPRPAQAKSLPNIMFVTSWNEWYEGSQIEPDNGTGGYDFTFIDELRDFKNTGAQCQ